MFRTDIHSQQNVSGKFGNALEEKWFGTYPETKTNTTT